MIVSAFTACSPKAPAEPTSASDETAAPKTIEPKDINVVFIPKLTGNMFFESANVGAQDIAKKVGFNCKYDGSPDAAVANQVQIINSAVNQGANAIAISSLSPDGLNQALKNAIDKGVKVVTWDSDVDPQYRSIYVNQGTPDLLGTMLVDMAASQMTDEQKQKAKFAFFYSSPTVTDQNSWVEYAKKYIAETYPGWELVTTQYGEQDAQKSLQVGQSILQTYADIDAILCPDSTALPAMAQAAKNLKKDGKVIITGFATPSSMRDFVKDGTVPKFGLWDCKIQGAIGAYVAYWLAAGNTFKVGDAIEVPGIGSLKVEPNTIQGYSYTAENSGIVLLPERVVFTKDNIDNYNF
ncbi:MAG: autoinducer 2 ABC transporter substrate-binding protein LsrB [Geosporobacter ferrireducens]|nr:autoinducer 2 ABC transporter substrate-binding protein LsrB [Geosporobacter ferrireducens]MTI57886.1 autoinducer 2 ABC transporter substrate-binding protein LsrB [Geosporobacter ferrireducens]